MACRVLPIQSLCDKLGVRLGRIRRAEELNVWIGRVGRAAVDKVPVVQESVHVGYYGASIERRSVCRRGEKIKCRSAHKLPCQRSHRRAALRPQRSLVESQKKIVRQPSTTSSWEMQHALSHNKRGFHCRLSLAGKGQVGG